MSELDEIEVTMERERFPSEVTPLMWLKRLIKWMSNFNKQ